MVSIIVPLLNEEPTLVELHQRIIDVFDQLRAEEGQGHEIVFVDDGSTDGSWSQIAKLAKQDPCVRGIRFRRNFGKAAALAAGFEAAKCDVVITMDADLQDDPKEIPRFLAKMNDGFDVVSGWKQVRHDPWHKTIPAPSSTDWSRG